MKAEKWMVVLGLFLVVETVFCIIEASRAIQFKAIVADQRVYIESGCHGRYEGQ